METSVPVEYAVAVDQYLNTVALSKASRRVYRISLNGWTWPLVGKPVPDGRARRGAVPPVVPLALMDNPATASRLARAYAERAAQADARTANRELSALRSAVGWWREQGWICADPVAGLQHRKPSAPGTPLSPGQVTKLFRLPASLREHAFWRLLFDSGAPATEVLGLDAGRLDLARHQTRLRPGLTGGDPADLQWQDSTTQALRWLLAGRTWGPVFLTGRRAPTGASAGDVCPVTGQGRMSYRRAAEIFTEATKPLDPAGHGWTLHQLSAAAMTARRAV